MATFTKDVRAVLLPSALVVLLSLLPGLAAAPAAAADGPAPAVPAQAGPTPAQIAWMRAHVVPFATTDPDAAIDDLRPAGPLIGDARIVGLGEATHGTREHFQMKHRLVEYLAREKGFTVFSIEASTPEAFRVNDYVLHGKGDPKELIAGMYFWTWNTEEVLALVEWMRAYNASGKGRIEFTGFDMQTPDVAIDNVVAFLEQVDAKRAEEVREPYSELASAGSAGGGFGVVTWTFPVEEARGKRVKYRGFLRTEGLKNGHAGLWWRADTPSRPGVAFDNMQDRGPRGTTEWGEFAIELDVPAEASNINFGLIMPGAGRSWFDDLSVTLDGEPYTGALRPEFDFETDLLSAYRSTGGAYEARFDSVEKHSGARSLRLESGSVPAGPDPAAALGLAEEVLRELEAARSRYEALRPAAEVDWAIHNARIVRQCMSSRVDGGDSRDRSMAANVAWLTERYPGEKIVLWAHNGHIGRFPGMMGSYLGERFGQDYLPVGFAARSGRYTASGGGGLGTHDLREAPWPSVEAHLHALGEPGLILDARPATAGSEESGWLAEPRMLRSIGAVAMDFQFQPTVVRDVFDLLVYVDSTTPAVQLDTVRPKPRGQEK